jgi:CBS domain containing-hemolysin-like protein
MSIYIPDSINIILAGIFVLLNNASIFFLRKAGIQNPDEHDAPLSQAEIRASLSRSHFTGELSGSEHRHRENYIISISF